MSSIYQIATVNEHLLSNIARTDITLGSVLFIYACIVAVAAALWVVGVLAFGRGSSEPAPSDPMLPAERATPVVP